MKLTKKEHTSLKGLVDQIKNVESAVAQLELQKQNAIIALREMLETLEGEKAKLTEKYGDVQIDVATGNFK